MPVRHRRADLPSQQVSRRFEDLVDEARDRKAILDVLDAGRRTDHRESVKWATEALKELDDLMPAYIAERQVVYQYWEGRRSKRRVKTAATKRAKVKTKKAVMK